MSLQPTAIARSGLTGFLFDLLVFCCVGHKTSTRNKCITHLWFLVHAVVLQAVESALYFLHL